MVTKMDCQYHFTTTAQAFWTTAKLPPHRAQPLTTCTLEQLMSSTSLIQVYICSALALSFLNLDVMWVMELEGRRSNLPEEYDVDMDEDLGANHAHTPLRRFKMRDDVMHRVYLPLTCAMKLCDSVRPERLAYIVADYLAGIVPLCSTAPVMLKYAQSLETYVARDHRSDLMWAEWTIQTLDLVKKAECLLEQMQSKGKLVKSFKRSSSIPRDVLHDTNIIGVLHEIVNADWGPDSQLISERATVILDGWTSIA